MSTFVNILHEIYAVSIKFEVPTMYVNKILGTT